MKKILTLACIASVGLLSNVQALEVKKPDIGALKNVTTSTASSKTDNQEASKKDAANKQFSLDYQKKIKDQQKMLNDVKLKDRQAREELAKIILEDKTANDIKKLTDEELNEAIVNTLKSEEYKQTFAEYSSEKKAAYKVAAHDVIVADNRYKNVSNELTAPLKQIVDGNVETMAVKDELKNAGAMIFGIKKNLGTNSDVLRAVKKVNKENNVYISFNDNERVIYPKTGTIGSINAQMEDIDNNVKKANETLSRVLVVVEDESNKIDVNRNENISEEGKDSDRQVKKSNKTQIDYEKSKEIYNKLSDAEKLKYKNASYQVFDAVVSYGALALSCTKLGFAISKNPLIAAPMAFELGALKDTGKLLKDSSSNLANSTVQVKKLNKYLGIVDDRKKDNNKNDSALNKVKSLKISK